MGHPCERPPTRVTVHIPRWGIKFSARPTDLRLGTRRNRADERRRVTTVKRRTWLIATLTALFVLQTPLCALACLPSPAPAESPAEAHHASPPCHEQTPTTAPTEPDDAHNDCGCEDVDRAVLASAADQTFSQVQSTPVLPARELRLSLIAAFNRMAGLQLNEANLPPPDILLLKSTLLI